VKYEIFTYIEHSIYIHMKYLPCQLFSVLWQMYIYNEQLLNLFFIMRTKKKGRLSQFSSAHHRYYYIYCFYITLFHYIDTLYVKSKQISCLIRPTSVKLKKKKKKKTQQSPLIMIIIKGIDILQSQCTIINGCNLQKYCSMLITMQKQVNLQRKKRNQILFEVARK